jgi:hypothetical protein
MILTYAWRLLRLVILLQKIQGAISFIHQTRLKLAVVMRSFNREMSFVQSNLNNFRNKYISGYGYTSCWNSLTINVASLTTNLDSVNYNFRYSTTCRFEHLKIVVNHVQIHVYQLTTPYIPINYLLNIIKLPTWTLITA